MLETSFLIFGLRADNSSDFFFFFLAFASLRDYAAAIYIA